MDQKTELMILGDWGTSACRLYLCSWQGQDLHVLERITGKGIKHVQHAEQYFFQICQQWFEQHNNLPVFLIGTVGANIGWKQVPYVSCPTDHHSLLEAATSFTARDVNITIFPGLSCLNQQGLPDVMRSEETQIFGFMAQQQDVVQNTLICLPGTHTKWALLNDNKIESFITSPVGELYEVLSHHSVLLKPRDSSTWCKSSFIEGVEVGIKESSNLLHTLFATRSKQILEDSDNISASCFLSGLLVGSDVKAAMHDFNLHSHVDLIGSDSNNALYIYALNALGVSTSEMNSETATLNGLKLLASQRWLKYE